MELAVLEGLLFLNGEEGISFEKIKDILEIDDSKLNELLDTLNNKYLEPTSGLRLVKFDNFYKITTKEEHKDYYKKLVELEDDSLLSQACLETLAIIAYNGPVTRMKVDEIRGINSSHMIRRLIAKNLVEDIGKTDLPGRPHLYNVTKDFLDYFGIESIKDLPIIEEKEIEDVETNLFESKYKEDN